MYIYIGMYVFDMAGGPCEVCGGGKFNTDEMHPQALTGLVMTPRVFSRI